MWSLSSMDRCSACSRAAGARSAQVHELLLRAAWFLAIQAQALRSYDTNPPINYPTRWAAQGGVLEGRIFMHFYGSKWPEKMTSAAFAPGLAWFLAHEAGHLYQRHREHSMRPPARGRQPTSRLCAKFPAQHLRMPSAASSRSKMLICSASRVLRPIRFRPRASRPALMVICYLRGMKPSLRSCATFSLC